MTSEILLTKEQVCERMPGGISTRTLDRWRNDKGKGFPKPVHLSDRVLGWDPEAVDNWLREQIKKAS